MTQIPMLLRIENERKILTSADNDFLYTLQAGLLLDLKARGLLNETQYRLAEQNLRARLNRTTAHDRR